MAASKAVMIKMPHLLVHDNTNGSGTGTSQYVPYPKNYVMWLPSRTSFLLLAQRHRRQQKGHWISQAISAYPLYLCFHVLPPLCYCFLTSWSHLNSFPRCTIDPIPFLTTSLTFVASLSCVIKCSFCWMICVSIQVCCDLPDLHKTQQSWPSSPCGYNVT